MSSNWIVFYDGHCGLCHKTVKFTIRADTKEIFQFAPQQGTTFQNLIAEKNLIFKNESLVVKSPDERLLFKSEAICKILDQLESPWPLTSKFLKLLPIPWRDWIYDRIASVRSIFFKSPKETCPRLPSKLKDKFLP